jgi:hypothetical protein
MTDAALDLRLTSIETTMLDIVIAMQKGFQRMEERFVLLETRMEKGFALMNERMDNFEIRLSVVEKKATAIEIILLDMQEELSGQGRAIDKDAVTLMGHEKRIVRLEKAR